MKFQIKIWQKHFAEDCKVDPSILPDDAVFKYYDTAVVQDIIITTKNTAYRKEVWYSPLTTSDIPRRVTTWN